VVRAKARERAAAVWIAASLLAAACGDQTRGPTSLADLLRTDSQPLRTEALDALRARPEGEVDVLHIVQLRDPAAYRRYEALIAPLRAAHGGTISVSTRVYGVLLGDDEYDEVRIVHYPSGAAYLGLLEDPAFAGAAIEERRAVARKTLLYGTPIALPVPTGGFSNPDFDDLTRAEAEELVQQRASDTSEGNPEVILDMLVEDSPEEFFMVNLMDFRELALYEDGQFPGSTGREADARYLRVVQPHLARRNSGGVHLLLLDENAVLVGDRPTWEQVAIARYASVDALLDMLFDPDFQAGSFHKFASLEDTVTLYTRGTVAPVADR
jgi:uncharacterized protein (DUF1330 family)